MKLNKIAVLLLEHYFALKSIPPSWGKITAFRSFHFQECYNQASRDYVYDDKRPKPNDRVCMIPFIWNSKIGKLTHSRKNQNSQSSRGEVGAKTECEETFWDDGNMIYLDRDLGFIEISFMESQRMHISCRYTSFYATFTPKEKKLQTTTEF